MSKYNVTHVTEWCGGSVTATLAKYDSKTGKVSHIIKLDIDMNDDVTRTYIIFDGKEIEIKEKDLCTR